MGWFKKLFQRADPDSLEEVAKRTRQMALEILQVRKFDRGQYQRLIEVLGKHDKIDPVVFFHLAMAFQKMAENELREAMGGRGGMNMAEMPAGVRSDINGISLFGLELLVLHSQLGGKNKELAEKLSESLNQIKFITS